MLQIPVIAVGVTYLCKNKLQHLVEHLCCPIHLWMIQDTLLMLYLKLLFHCVDCAIDEVTPLVAHQYPWEPKLSDNVVK